MRKVTLELAQKMWEEHQVIVVTTEKYITYFAENEFNIFLKRENDILYYSKELKENKQCNY